MFKSLLLRQVRPRLNPKFNRGLTTQKPPRVCGGFCLAEKERFDRATGSGARVNEPKTVRRTVFGEAKAPKQGAFRAVIYGGDGRRLATRRALACLHAEIISPSDQSALNSPSLRCGRIANSVGSPSEKAVLYPRVRRDNESSAEPYTVGEARQISPSPRIRLLLCGTSWTPSPTGYAAVSFSKRKRGLVEPSENKHIDLNDGLGFAPRAPLPAPLLAFGLIIPYSVRFVNRPFRLTIKLS